MDESRQDDAAFTALFRELYPRLCRFLGSMLGDSRRAEELAQESLLRLFNSPMRLAAADDARNWVFRVGRNLALNERKHTATVKRLTPLRDLASEKRPATPEQQLQHKQELALVLGLVCELPETQRAALLLREHEQMTYEQIGAVLNISLANVKVSVFRARRNLRDGWRQAYVCASKARETKSGEAR